MKKPHSNWPAKAIKNTSGEAIAHGGVSAAQRGDHGNDDDADSGDGDVSQGDTHGGEFGPFIGILGQDAGHCTVGDIDAGVAENQQAVGEIHVNDFP